MSEFEKFKKAMQTIVATPPEEAKRIRDRFPIEQPTRTRNKKRPDAEAPDRES